VAWSSCVRSRSVPACTTVGVRDGLHLAEREYRVRGELLVGDELNFGLSDQPGRSRAAYARASSISALLRTVRTSTENVVLTLAAPLARRLRFAHRRLAGPRQRDKPR
jgi:hypothetical protein